MIPPMVGPTWSRAVLTLGSDYVLALFQRTRLVMWCLGRRLVISYVPIGCVSYVPPSCRCLRTILSDSAVIWGCTSTFYCLVIMRVGVRLHGALYPMTDCVLYLGGLLCG